jgi:hypothetical protein
MNDTNKKSLFDQKNKKKEKMVPRKMRKKYSEERRKGKTTKRTKDKESKIEKREWKRCNYGEMFPD